MCPSYLRHVPACIRFVSREVSQLNRMEQNFPVSLFTVTCVLGDLIWVATKISSVDEDTSFESDNVASVQGYVGYYSFFYRIEWVTASISPGK